MSTPAPTPTDGPEPVCPRHPDRISYVRCQRCERPACPACQRVAAVGVQCVDCVREQARQTRSATTVFGGRPAGDVPRVTYALIGACVVLFLLQLASGNQITDNLAFEPSLAGSQPWRFVTSAFLHSTGFVLHIGFNMLVLYQVGPYLEQALGRARYLALYLISAFGGSVGYLLLADPLDPFSWNRPVVGASGAVFGLFGGLLVVQRRLGQRSGGLFGLVALNFGLGFVFANVAWQSHLGGLITGAVVAAAIALPRGPRRAAIQTGAVLGVLALLVLLAAVRVGTG
jgi:membrane associated rhomboid family serine protease